MSRTIRIQHGFYATAAVHEILAAIPKSEKGRFINDAIVRHAQIKETDSVRLDALELRFNQLYEILREYHGGVGK